MGSSIFTNILGILILGLGFYVYPLLRVSLLTCFKLYKTFILTKMKTDINLRCICFNHDKLLHDFTSSGRVNILYICRQCCILSINTRLKQRTRNVKRWNIKIFMKILNESIICKGGILYLIWIRQGIARTQSPTQKNCVPELLTFGAIAGFSQTEVQWKGLDLGRPPFWSRCSLYQVSMLVVNFPKKLYKNLFLVL